MATPALCNVDVNKIKTYDREKKSKDDKVTIEVSSMSNMFYPIFFYDVLITKAAILEYTTSIGMNSTAIYDNKDNFLFCNDNK